MNWGWTSKENKPRSYVSKIKTLSCKRICSSQEVDFSLVGLGCAGKVEKWEMLGECQSSVLHNLFQIDWSTCKNRRPFFLLDLHQYVKTKPEARETKRLLSEEMSCSIPLHAEVCVGGVQLEKTAASISLSLGKMIKESFWTVVVCCPEGRLMVWWR